MSVTARLDGATYERLVATDPSFERTELFDGIPVEKPLMSWFHGDLGGELGIVIGSSLDRRRFRVRSNHARLALPEGNYYIPDLAIVPNDPPDSLADLDLYRKPVPLVVEIRSPSTGGYDAATKLPGYRLRGDAEIWWIDLPDRSLTRWVRRPHGGYDVEILRGGVVELAALADVRVDLDALFLGVPEPDR